MDQLNLYSEREVVLNTKKDLKSFIKQILFENIIKKVDENASFNDCEVIIKSLFTLEPQELDVMHIKLMYNLNMYDTVEANSNIHFTFKLTEKLINGGFKLDGRGVKIEGVSFLYDKDQDN